MHKAFEYSDTFICLLSLPFWKKHHYPHFSKEQKLQVVKQLVQSHLLCDEAGLGFSRENAGCVAAPIAHKITKSTMSK